MANNNNKTKMVIVVRKDIVDISGQDSNKMGAGKLAAQISHGVLGVFLKKMRNGQDLENYNVPTEDYKLELKVNKHTAMSDWLEYGFTKVVLGAKNETQFLNSYNKIKEAGYEVSLIKDAGHTVFDNIHTHTCYVVEPAYKEDIDKLTKRLQVLNLKC